MLIYNTNNNIISYYGFIPTKFISQTPAVPFQTLTVTKRYNPFLIVIQLPLFSIKLSLSFKHVTTMHMRRDT